MSTWLSRSVPFAIALCAAAPAFALEPEAVARSLLAEARLFEHGEGVSRDPARAAALYCQASKLGEAEAQFNLAWMYANGRGVERDRWRTSRPG